MHSIKIINHAIALTSLTFLSLSGMEIALDKIHDTQEQLLLKVGEYGLKEFYCLLKSDSDQDGMGEKLLWEAVLRNNLIACSFLIAYGVNVNTRDADKQTPLMVAAKKGFLEVCLELLKNGGLIFLCDKDGNSAITDADKETLALLMKYAPVELQRKLSGAESAPD